MLTTHPVFSKFLQGGPLAIPEGGMLLGGRHIIGGGPTDGQALIWDASLQRYEPQDLPAGGGASAHGDLTGVTSDQHHAQSHTVASHSDTTATGAELNELTGGGATSLHSHAGGSSPLTTKGDIYTYDTADARLPVGADDTVLQAESTEATGLIWRAKPQLAGILDTGGTERVTIATSGRHLTFDARFDMAYNDNIASGIEDVIRIQPSIASMAGTWYGINIQPTLTSSGNNRTGYGVIGNMFFYGASGGSGYAQAGLFFTSISLSSNVTTTYTRNRGVDVFAQAWGIGVSAVLTVTELTALRAQVGVKRTGANTVTAATARGLWIVEPQHISGGTITDYFGAAIEDYTGGSPTKNYLLEVGGTIGTLPYFRVAGNFTAAANQTPIYISEGVTPTLRQLTTMDPGAGGANFAGGERVCLL
jgi:hypothetical protein